MPHTIPSVLLAVSLAAGLAGCGGKAPRGEGEFVSGAIAGRNAQVGQIKIRDIRVAEPTKRLHPVGSDVLVRLQLFNASASDDALVGAQTAAATSVWLQQDADGDGRFTRTDRVPLPAGVQPGRTRPQAQLLLVKTTRDLVAGRFMPLTLSFARAGSISLVVPIEIPNIDRSGAPAA